MLIESCIEQSKHYNRLQYDSRALKLSEKPGNHQLKRLPKHKKQRCVMSNETNEEKLARLEQELAELKGVLPEHCYGTKGYVNVHQASLAHWQKIEDLEEEITKLKAEMGL